MKKHIGGANSWAQSGIIRLMTLILSILLFTCGCGIFDRPGGLVAGAVYEDEESWDSDDGDDGDGGHSVSADNPYGSAEDLGFNTPLSAEAQAYADELVLLNSGAASQTEFDPEASQALPSQRNIYSQWDKTMFNRMKAVNTSSYTADTYRYDKTRKQFVNKLTGNTIEFEIYTDRSTDCISMVVSIEYVGDRLEITDYYFTDSGRIDFIFVRGDTVYTPEYAMLSKHGQRFFFRDDQMVKWRIVDSNSREYPIGPNELARGGKAVSTCVLYSDLSASMQAEYDEMELKMLRQAYSVYDLALNRSGASTITGVVEDVSGRPSSGVEVKLYNEELSSWVYSCSTDADGKYSIRVPSEENSFRLYMKGGGCTDVMVFNIGITSQVVYSYVENVCMVSTDAQNCDVRLLAIDAYNTTSDTYSDGYAPGLVRLVDATIAVRPGVNNRSTGTICMGQTDEYGYLDVNLAPGCYTVQVDCAGYETSYITIIVRQSGEVLQLTTSPVLAGGELRIVLTWGATPYDLDSHLFTPLDGSSDDPAYHIWYGNMSDHMNNYLDVDDTSSYGPETMTIHNLGDGQYKYYVADYTNCSANNTSSYEMSASGAKVSVYSDHGLIASFSVPTNTPGVIWEVFEIRDGQIIPLQRYYSNIADKPWWHQDKGW